MFPQYSKAQIYVRTQKPLNGEPLFDKRKRNKGRPSKLSSQDNSQATEKRWIVYFATSTVRIRCVLSIKSNISHVPKCQWLQILTV